MAKAHKKKAALRARAAKELRTSLVPPSSSAYDESFAAENSTDSDDCGYEGGVSYVWSESEDSEYQLGSEDEWSDVDEDLEEMNEDDLPPIKIPAIFTDPKMEVDWKNVEKNRSLGYTGTSERTAQRHAQKAREQEAVRQEAKTSTDPQKVLMREMFKPKPKKTLPHVPPLQSNLEPSPITLPVLQQTDNETLTGWDGILDLVTYQSDDSSYETDEDDELANSGGTSINHITQLEHPATSSRVTVTLPTVAVDRSIDDIGAAAQTQSALLDKSTHSAINMLATPSIIACENRKRPRTETLLPDNINLQNKLQIRVPELKRRKLDIPYREQRLLGKNERSKHMADAWKAVQKLLSSKKTNFESGQRGLQQRRARAIECHLRLVIKNGRTSIEASKISAEAHFFSVKHGSRQLRAWTRKWVAQRVLPTSKRGMHTKMYSLFNDPQIVTELRAFLRSHKWAMNPEKLSQFTQHKLIPSVAEAYLRHIIKDEMPKGLKRYMEVVLFPRIHLKVGRGVSISTARRWMRREGFRFMSYKKGLYYDGHDRADVVEYRQKSFLPEMERHRKRLVQYVVGSVEHEHLCQPDNYVERRLVLCAHDEMTAQAHDGKAKSWVLDNQHALRKKGVGRGIHQSDIICSTVGWLSEASQTLEYGKNYEGYWTGELFIKQLREKIIPAFEKAHGPGHQALFMIDNSQGHSAYAENALLVTRMNVKPGGKQARMRDGWFTCNGQKVSQSMIFAEDHPKFSNMAKGINAVLAERGLYEKDLRGKCNKCEPGAHACCNKRILELQPDFQEQKSMVREVIEAAGHLCIFLPKFHCELNFIEFFWGAVKRYLRENCDYTFDTLKTNMLKALESVQLQTIRKWELRVFRWMEAYRAGLSTNDAQLQVKQYSSTKYKSHRRIPQSVANTFD